MNRHAKVVRNVLALLVNQVGTWTVTLVTTLVVPPYLGVKLYGAYAFTVSYVGFFGLIMSLGTGTYLTWRIAREPDQASRLTVHTLLLQIPLGVVMAAGALGILPFLDRDPLLFHLALIVVATAILSGFSATGIASLGGLQNMRIPAQLSLATSALSATAAITCVVLHQNILVLAGSGLAMQALSTVTMLSYTHMKIPLRARVEPRLWYTVVAGGLPFFTWSAVLLFYWQIDIPLLKVMAGDTAVAWYSVANRIGAIPIFLPTIITTAILPALSSERSPDSSHFQRLASRSIRMVSLVDIPACIGTMLLATSLLPLLHYPTSFNQAIPLIMILALNMPLVALDMVMGAILIAMGKQKAWTGVGVIAAVINPIVNLWAIPATQHAFGNGAIGASLTTVLSEAIMFFGALYLRPRGVFTRWDVFYIARCLLAAAAMLPAVWGLASQQRISIIPAVIYGAIVYAFAAYTLQVVRNEDILGAFTLVLGRMGIASPADLWIRVRSTLFGAGRSKRALDRVALRAGAVAAHPLIYSGDRLPAASQTLQPAQREAPPVRFGPPIPIGSTRIDNSEGNGQSTFEHAYGAIEAFQDTLPLRVASTKSAHARYNEDGYREIAAVERTGRSLPPAPAARRLRRALADVSAEPRRLTRSGNVRRLSGGLQMHESR